VRVIVATHHEEEAPMRTLFRGGRIFDGSGAPLADGDLVIEDGRIVAVGSGLE